MSKFKLAISNIVAVPMNVTINDGGVKRSFAFTLECDRLSEPDLKEQIKVKGEETPTEFMRPLIHGWKGQKLVLDAETGEPAAFSEDALDAMLSVVGVGNAAYASFQKTVTATGKN